MHKYIYISLFSSVTHTHPSTFIHSFIQVYKVHATKVKRWRYGERKERETDRETDRDRDRERDRERERQRERDRERQRQRVEQKGDGYDKYHHVHDALLKLGQCTKSPRGLHKAIPVQKPVVTKSLPVC